MSEAQATKFNFPKSSTYIEIPYDFLGLLIKKGVETVFDGLTDYALFMLALIHTMNKAVKGYCKIEYEDFIARFGGSKSTVKRCKDLLINKGIIEEVGRSKYKIIAAYNKNPHIRVGDYLHKRVFDITLKVNNKTYTINKRLRRSAIIQLSFLLEHNENEKKNGIFTGSQRRLGKAVNMPRTTSAEALREIIGAELCTSTLITTDEYGAGKKGLSKYEVDDEVKAVTLGKKQVKEVPEPQPSKEQSSDPQPPKKLSRRKRAEQEAARRTLEAQQAELRVKIDQHYSNLRYEAEQRAEAEQTKALSDKQYSEIYSELKELAIKVAFAGEVKAEPLNARRAELEAAGDKRLAELGVDKRLFKPRYKCAKCSDTGYLPTGQACECMKKLIKELKIKA